MFRHAQRYLLAGVLTVIPILVTVFVFDFVLGVLSNVGKPTVLLIAQAVGGYAPEVGRWLVELPWLQSGLAILLTGVGLYLLGWGASRILGRRVLAVFESFLSRIPLVTKVYGSTKQFLEALQSKPSSKLQRVVLIEFPHKEMKAVGFVTGTFSDEINAIELATVYVPTTPNPTSGYLEIVPVDRLVSLDWSIDEAMTFIISGGTVSPGRIQFANSEGRGTSEPACPAPKPGASESGASRKDLREPDR